MLMTTGRPVPGITALVLGLLLTVPVAANSQEQPANPLPCMESGTCLTEYIHIQAELNKRVCACQDVACIEEANKLAGHSMAGYGQDLAATTGEAALLFAMAMEKMQCEVKVLEGLTDDTAEVTRRYEQLQAIYNEALAVPATADVERVRTVALEKFVMCPNGVEPKETSIPGGPKMPEGSRFFEVTCEDATGNRDGLQFLFMGTTHPGVFIALQCYREDEKLWKSERPGDALLRDCP